MHIITSVVKVRVETMSKEKPWGGLVASRTKKKRRNFMKTSETLACEDRLIRDFYGEG